MIYAVPTLFTLSPVEQTTVALQPPPNEEVQGLALLLLILALVVCLIGTMVTLTALMPGVTGRSQAALQRWPWRAFFIGLVNYVFLTGMALIIFSAAIDILNLIGVFILAFLAAVTALGLGGLTQLTGERMAAMRTSEMSPLKQVVWGAVVLELTGLLPLVGWFLFTPIILMIAFGAAVLGWRSRKQVKGELSL